MSFLRTLPRIFASRPTNAVRQISSVAPVNNSPPKSSPRELTFAEEPLGLSAEQGFGYVQLQFGQHIGPDDKYEILRKLGWGSYSSVWLAKDHQKDDFVAVKALSAHATALDLSGVLQEMEFSSSITQFIKNCEHPIPYCIQYLSHFQHSSESGEHLCLVFEVCRTDVDRMWSQFPVRIIPAALVKKILRDVLHGLSQLHALRCVHTDLKAGNILCRTPPPDLKQVIQMALYSEPFVLNPSEQSLHGMVQSAKSQPLPVPSLDEALAATYILGDFGHAQHLDHQTTPFISPELYRAPESIMLGPWGTKVDLWAFGCMTYELLCAASLFVRTHPTIPADMFHVAQMVKYTGQTFPVDLIQGYKEAATFLDLETGNFQGNPTKLDGFLRKRFDHLAGKNGVTQHDMDGAFSLIEQCLQLNPADRPTAYQLLCTSDWLMELGPVDF